MKKAVSGQGGCRMITNKQVSTETRGESDRKKGRQNTEIKQTNSQ